MHKIQKGIPQLRSGLEILEKQLEELENGQTALLFPSLFSISMRYRP